VVVEDGFVFYNDPESESVGVIHVVREPTWEFPWGRAS
jgi:hypothetical protein